MVLMDMGSAMLRHIKFELFSDVVLDANRRLPKLTYRWHQVDNALASSPQFRRLESVTIFWRLRGSNLSDAETTALTKPSHVLPKLHARGVLRLTVESPRETLIFHDYGR